MTTTKPQKIDPKQVRQFLADAQKKVVAARRKSEVGHRHGWKD
jgi:hypothetical protein